METRNRFPAPLPPPLMGGRGGGNKPILPGATIGILGSGQLGRMLAVAARQMGYRVHTFSPEKDSPTGQVADREIVAAYDDLDAVREFARNVDVVTFEFENVSHAATAAAAEYAPVRPDGSVLHITQNRLREKNFSARPRFPGDAIRRCDESGGVGRRHNGDRPARRFEDRGVRL